MRLIRKDSHGLYILCGTLYRPYSTPHTWHYAIAGAVQQGGVSHFTEGQKVKARQVPQTPTARLKDGQHTERWSSHGEYLDDKGKPIKNTDAIWTPE